jgi:hypothetical protein
MTLAKENDSMQPRAVWGRRGDQAGYNIIINVNQATVQVAKDE